MLSVITGAFFWKNRLHQETLADGNTYGGLLCEIRLLSSSVCRCYFALFFFITVSCGVAAQCKDADQVWL